MALTSTEGTQHCVKCFFNITPLARTLSNSFLGQAKESTLWWPSPVIKARYIWKPCNSWSIHTTYSFSTMTFVLSLGYFCMCLDHAENKKHLMTPKCQAFSNVHSVSSVSRVWKLFPKLCTSLAKCSKTQGNGLSIGGFWPLGDMGSFRGNLHKDYGPKKPYF